MIVIIHITHSLHPHHSFLAPTSHIPCTHITHSILASLHPLYTLRPGKYGHWHVHVALKNLPPPIFLGRWRNMDVAIKIMLFQNTPQRVPAPHGYADEPCKGASKQMDTRQLVLREAAVCCSMSHPNVVATYHYEVVEATAFKTPMGLSITDQSGERAYKVYLIQVGSGQWSVSCLLPWVS